MKLQTEEKMTALEEHKAELERQKTGTRNVFHFVYCCISGCRYLAERGGIASTVLCGFSTFVLNVSTRFFSAGI